MVALALFFIPALWLGYVLGYALREGLAALLYYRLADVTPWLIAHQHAVVIAAAALAVMGNLSVLSKMHFHMQTRLAWSLPLAFVGGVLWLVAVLVQPGWWLGAFGGLVMFPLMMAVPLAAAFAYTVMLKDELLAVLAVVAMWLVVVGLIHMGVMWMLPSH